MCREWKNWILELIDSDNETKREREREGKLKFIMLNEKNLIYRTI